MERRLDRVEEQNIKQDNINININVIDLIIFNFSLCRYCLLSLIMLNLMMFKNYSDNQNWDWKID